MSTRRIEGNFNQGWGVAAFITLLAVGGFVLAFTVNRSTHHSPNDVLAPVGGEAKAPDTKAKAH
jgi:hypothetical protein